MKRLPGWRGRFEAVVDEIKRRPFDWSAQHDCGIGLCARLIEALTGEDLAEAYRGRYDSAAGALRLMRDEGFDNLAELAAAALPEVHPSRTRIGDIAAFPVETAFGFALGVVNGEMAFVLREDGMGMMPLLAATRAFKVG